MEPGQDAASRPWLRGLQQQWSWRSRFGGRAGHPERGTTDRTLLPLRWFRRAAGSGVGGGRLQSEHEGAAGAELARVGDAPTLELGQPLAQMEAQTRTPFTLSAELLEGTEEPALILRADAHAGVGDAEVDQ